jgi:hypothetical protein
MKRQVEYFEKAGKENTKVCLEIVKNLVSKGHKNIVVATTSGETGVVFVEEFGKKINCVVVTHSAGFKEINKDELLPENKEKILNSGAKIYTGTILTHSIETCLAQKFSGSYPTLLIAQTLRRLGEGVKVCCEIVMEGCDAGLLPEGEPVVAVAGTGWGADTVCIIKSAASKRFLDLKVMEILAKPREW